MRNIALPDGRTLSLTGQETPDQLSALKQKLSQKFVSEPAPQVEAPTQEQGFTQRLSEDFESRTQKIEASRQRTATGEQGAIRGGIQQAGQAAGLALDVIGEAGVSAFRALPDVIEQPLREAGAETIETLGKLPT